MIAALPILLAATAAAPLEVAVIPLRGTAPELDKKEAVRVLLETLTSVDGIRAISLEKIGAVLGPDAERAIAACSDDACLVRETKRIRSDRLIAGSLDRTDDRLTLRLRLIETATKAAVLVRVSREVDARELKRAVAESALELFQEAADKSMGALSLSGVPEGATIYVDKKPVPSADLRLKPGIHDVAVYLPGHALFRENVDVVVGQKKTIEVSLSKNRANGPYYLAALGAAAAGVAIVLGATAQSKADAWNGACPDDRCKEGFTRARYDEDRASVDARALSANGLYAVSAGAIVASIVWFVLDPGQEDGAASEASGGAGRRIHSADHRPSMDEAKP